MVKSLSIHALFNINGLEFQRIDRFWWNIPLVSLIFLKRSLVFSILLFPSISLHWSLKKAFLFLLAILWNSAFRCLYLSFSPLLFPSLLSQLCKASPDSHFAFLHFFSMGMVLIPVSCTMSWTSFRSSSGTLSIRSRPLNLFSLPLYNHKGFDLGHTWMVYWFSPVSSILVWIWQRHSWSEPQWAPVLFSPTV